MIFTFCGKLGKSILYNQSFTWSLNVYFFLYFLYGVESARHFTVRIFYFTKPFFNDVDTRKTILDLDQLKKLRAAQRERTVVTQPQSRVSSPVRGKLTSVTRGDGKFADVLSRGCARHVVQQCAVGSQAVLASLAGRLTRRPQR